MSFFKFFPFFYLKIRGIDYQFTTNLCYFTSQKIGAVSTVFADASSYNHFEKTTCGKITMKCIIKYHTFISKKKNIHFTYSKL